MDVLEKLTSTCPVMSGVTVEVEITMPSLGSHPTRHIQ